MRKIDVSIIIVNYNTLELTRNTIESIFEKTNGVKYEIILVDNASIDGSVEFFRNNYKDKIIFIRNNENLGFGKANNKGIERSKGKYVFLLNSDTLLINNAIKTLFDYMEENKECGICGANLYTIDLKPTHSYLKTLPNITFEISYYFNYFKKIYKKLLNKRDDFNYSKFPVEVGYITGADMFIRKKILEKIGMFDIDFFMYSEETELTYRVKKEGYKVISVPQAKIIHLEGKSSKVSLKKLSLFLEGKYCYYYKVYGLKKCEQLYKIMILSIILKSFLTMDSTCFIQLKINKLEFTKLKDKIKNGKISK